MDSGVFSGQLTLTGSAQALSTTTFNPVTAIGNANALTIKNMSTANKVYVGGASVTSSNGFEVDIGASVSLDRFLGSNLLYVIGTSGQKVSILGTTT